MITATPITGDDPGLVEALTAADLPVEDIADEGRHFFCFKREGRHIGYGGFELYGRDALIRSIVIPEASRGQGHGRSLVEALLQQAQLAGAGRVFLLTTSASSFFEHHGFERTERASAPATIIGTRQASSICSSAALLSREL